MDQTTRKKRNRAKIKSRSQRPRLSVFRSHRYLWTQIIDDQKGVTLVSASDKELSSNKKPVTQKTQKDTESTEKKSSVPSEKLSVLSDSKKYPKTQKAKLVGALIAKKALKLGIRRVVFDRGAYQYHGRLKALAEGARKGGLNF